jgi:FMN phosphatase YigB (HAD superfamily)
VENVTHYRKYLLGKPVNLTILLDMDNTLLGNDMGEFIPAYLDLISHHMSSYMAPTKFVECVLAATQQMAENDDPNRTLQEAFDDYFYPKLGLNKEVIQKEFLTFFDNVYPRLRKLTQFRPEAVHMVENAITKGHRLVVATNPFFSENAINQRLTWAGLPPQDYPFELISSSDTFHFTKPNLAFFAEVLAQLGWPDDPAIMVGDDWEMDILPAQQMDLGTFWISENSQQESSLAAGKHYTGGLSEILPWLEHKTAAQLESNYSPPEALLAILIATPAALNTWLTNLSDWPWTSKPFIEEWSLTEILCHLRDVEAEVNKPRIDAVLKEENPFIQGENTDRWAEERDYRHQDGRQALADFNTFRLQNLSQLDSLVQEDWHRPARHTIFGPTDLLEIVNIIAGHDRLHLQQIKTLLDALKGESHP